MTDFVAQANAEAAQEFDDLRDKIVDLFNPPDDDIAEFAILVEALDRAHQLIVALPCSCTEPWPLGDPCPRCEALGRCNDERIER